MENLISSTHQDYSYYSCGKWLYYPDRIACIKRGDFRDVTPVTAQLVPSLYCNFYCPHCCYGRSKENIRLLGDRRAMLMDGRTMSVIIDRLSDAGIKGIVFTGGGEPTSNLHLLDGMRYAAHKGIKTGLFTNGSLLTLTKIHRLLELEPTFIRVSLDAGTSDVHRLLHGYPDKHDHFPKVLENIELLAKGKLIQKVDTTIGVGVTVEPVNLHNLVELAERLREIAHRSPAGGIDYLVFRPTVNYQGGKSFQSVQPLLDYMKKQIPEYYEAYHDYLYKGGQLPAQVFETADQIIEGEVSRLLDETGIRIINVRAKMHGVTQSNHPFRKCRASPWYIFVGPDGTVYNCAELGLDPRVAIGNLLTQSLDEIWKSQRRREVLDFIDNDGLHTLCPPVCLYTELNCLFERLDAAIRAGNGQRYEAVKWMEWQEARIQTEVACGVYNQPHREFM